MQLFQRDQKTFLFFSKLLMQYGYTTTHSPNTGLRAAKTNPFASRITATVFELAKESSSWINWPTDGLCPPRQGSAHPSAVVVAKQMEMDKIQFSGGLGNALCNPLVSKFYPNILLQNWSRPRTLSALRQGPPMMFIPKISLLLFT